VFVFRGHEAGNDKNACGGFHQKRTKKSDDKALLKGKRRVHDLAFQEARERNEKYISQYVY
jgi:hypothetical protein